MEQPMQGQGNVYPRWIAVVSLIFLWGCASHQALRLDFEHFSKAYGESSNKQLLLNLARLSRDEPVHFIQLETISSQYQVNTSLGLDPTYIFRHTAAELGASLNAGLTQTPIFQFLPLTGTNLVQAVLTPLSDKVFMIFYDQGYPADLLARIMVASVHYPRGGGRQQFLVNDPRDPSYPDFLEFCAELRHAQLSHALSVDSTPTNALLYTTPVSSVRLTDIATTFQVAGLSMKFETNGTGEFRLYEALHDPKWIEMELTEEGRVHSLFQETPGTNPEYTGDSQLASSKLAGAKRIARDLVLTNADLKVRTFEAAMYCVAKEQGLFEELRERQKIAPDERIQYRSDKFGVYAEVRREDGSKLVVRPALKMTHTRAEHSQLASPTLAETRYGGRLFTIGDVPRQTQDETVFTILSYLFSQTAISTQNLPVQQLIRIQ